MRKVLTFAWIAISVSCFAQVTRGRETVQDAIRFEKQKEAAAARQARIERAQQRKSSAERSTPRNTTSNTNRQKSGTTDRSNTKK